MDLWVCRLGYDPMKTWASGTGEGEEKIFISRRGEAIHSPECLWTLGRKAFLSITIDDPAGDIDHGVDEFDQVCTSYLKNYKELGEYFADKIDKHEFEVQDLDGNSVDGEKLLQAGPLGVARLSGAMLTDVEYLRNASTDFLEFSRMNFAAMTLFALSDIEIATFAAEDGADWLVDMYSDARDMWEFSRLANISLQKRSALGKIGAAARHSENHDMKKQAIAFYLSQKRRFTSRAHAAREITKLVPVTERVIYRWLSEADKRE